MDSWARAAQISIFFSLSGVGTAKHQTGGRCSSLEFIIKRMYDYVFRTSEGLVKHLGSLDSSQIQRGQLPLFLISLGAIASRRFSRIQDGLARLADWAVFIAS